jgi:hypothetical protein
MNEEQWLACTTPWTMFEFLQTKADLSQRKGRLFACAAVRRVWHLLRDRRSRKAVEVSERFADGLAGARELAQAAWDAWEPIEKTIDDINQNQSGAWDAAVAAWRPCEEWTASVLAEVAIRACGDDLEAEEKAQAALLRDIFGPSLFREVVLDLAWDGGTVKRLAEAAYAERQLPAGTLDTARLDVLADALEEAGCTDAEMLGHLRGAGQHWRGCWCVDLLTGRQ